MDDNSDPHLALLEFRNTPINDRLGSPTQRLMGRRTKTLIPTSETLLCPKTIKPSSTIDTLKTTETKSVIRSVSRNEEDGAQQLSQELPKHLGHTLSLLLKVNHIVETEDTVSDATEPLCTWMKATLMMNWLLTLRLHPQ